ncbi:MAG: diguanylate cyclase [Gammaproteobacteria bacterium]
MFTTYRARLFFYITLLAIFLSATLGYTYWVSRDLIITEVENSFANTARLLTGNVEMEENELLHYAEVVRDDLRIQEYMFMITKVGAEAGSLETLYDRSFGWLPIERYVFVGINGGIQLGNKHADLTHALLSHTKNSKDGIFYFQGNNGLELAAWAPVSYQGTPLGMFVVTHILNSGWLETHRNYSGGNLFIEQNNTVNISTLPTSEGKTFLPSDGHVVLNNEIYHVRPIPLSGEGRNTPHLWYGISEQELLDQLQSHGQLVLMLTILGTIAIMFLGLMITRNFSRPLNQLMQITQAVTQGAIPVMGKSTETNEVDTLANRFSEMLQSLREKQEEIERTHKLLEESAIMDSLTGLYNRRYLKQMFPKLLSQARRDGSTLSGLMLDLDHFKKINDNYGHLVGDACLSHLGVLLKQSSRASDYVFRVGGEEFLILSLGESPVSSEMLAKKINHSLSKQPFSSDQTIITMTASIGVSHVNNKLPAESALTNLLFQADKALYSAKNKGRNRVVIYSSEEHFQAPLKDAAS